MKPESKEKKSKYIFFSFLSDVSPSDDTEIFDYLYGKMTVLASAYDYRVVWWISPLLAKKLSREMPLSKTYARVRWDKAECRRFLKRSEFAVVDTLDVATSALALGKETLLMYNRAVPEDYKSGIDGAFVSDCFEGVLKEAERKMSGACTVPFLLDCPETIDGAGKTETVVCHNEKSPEDKKSDKEMLLLWERCSRDRDKILELINSRKYDELSLLFNSLENAIKKHPEKGSLRGWDSEIIAAFAEVLKTEGVKEPLGDEE